MRTPTSHNDTGNNLPSPAASTAERSLTHCNLCQSPLESHGDCSNKDCDTHQVFILTLAHGPNTDIEGGYWQEPTSPKLVTLEVTNLRDAQTSFQAWRDANGLGAGNMTKRSGTVRRKGDCRLVGRFSYNGRFWNPQGKEVVCAS